MAEPDDLAVFTHSPEHAAATLRALGFDVLADAVEEALAEAAALRAAQGKLLAQLDEATAARDHEREQREAERQHHLAEMDALFAAHRGARERARAEERAAGVAFLGRAARHFDVEANAAAESYGPRSATFHALREVKRQLEALATTLRDHGPDANQAARFDVGHASRGERGARGGTRR